MGKAKLRKVMTLAWKGLLSEAQGFCEACIKEEEDPQKKGEFFQISELIGKRLESNKFKVEKEKCI